MQIKLLEPKSYCAGVQNAINIAIKAKKDYPNKNIYILGKLVHNQIVINWLYEQGIHTLYEDGVSLADLLTRAEPNSVVIFSAHGHVPKLDEVAWRRNLIVYDATCPKVKSNHDLILNELKNNHQIIYIGIKNHPESNAALSLGDDVLFYNTKMGIDYSKVKDDSPFVINQTTLNTLEIKEIYKDILLHVPNARIQEEICNTTRLRQEALINLPKEYDLIIIVGDSSSSNTKRLYEIASMSHKDSTVLMVSNILDLDTSILLNRKNIAIASGASTPLSAISDIENEIKKLYNLSE